MLQSLFWAEVRYVKFCIFTFLIFATANVRAADFPKFLKLGVSSGVFYESNSISNSAQQKSKITSSPSLFLGLLSEIQIADYIIFAPKVFLKQVHYNNSPYYKIIEDKNYLVDAELSFLSALNTRFSVETAFSFKEKNFFKENLRDFQTYTIGSLGVSFKLSYLFLNLSKSKFYSSLSYAVSSPSDSKEIEVLTGEFYTLSFKHKREGWPSMFLKYKMGQQETNFFEQATQVLTLGVEYDF